MPSPEPAPDRFTISVKGGDFVFREGDAGAEIYIIEEGQVELESSAAPQHKESLEVGDFFGTGSLLTEAPREISARAVGQSRLIRLDRGALMEIVRAQPEIALLMLQRVAERAGQAAPIEADVPAAVFIHLASSTRFPLEGSDFGIGRASKAAGIVPEVDLTALDPEKTLSRRHARLRRTPDGYLLKEEEGRNGTFVNGNRIGPGQEVRLEEGDRIRFGLVEVIFRKE
jgi:CRP-like cAMP-binding protein